jgi:hypothetical protein
MKPEDLITYGLFIGAVGFGLRLISWSIIGIIDYMQHPFIVKAGDTVVTETVAVFNSADFNSVMLKPFLHQIDYIGACLFYGSLLTISGVLIFAISTKTKLNFTEKFVEGQDIPDSLFNGSIITHPDNIVFPTFSRYLSTVQTKGFFDAVNIAKHGLGDANQRYSDALIYMKNYFPINDATTVYLKCKLRLMSYNDEDCMKYGPEKIGIEAQRFVYDTIVDYIRKQDPTITDDLIVHASNALMEFTVWLTSSGAPPVL